MFWDLICHNLHCPHVHSVPLPPLNLSAVLQRCLYCMSVYIHTCIKASSIQLVMEKEVPSSDIGLLLCTGVNTFFFCVKMCINAFTGGLRACSSDVLFFSRHIRVSVFPYPCHEHSEPHEAFYCTQSEEGQIKLIETHLKLCSVPFWTVPEEDGLF